MSIARKCKKCARLNIEAEIRILIPFNTDEPDSFDVWDAIDSGEETGVYFCRDCRAIVETEVVQR